MNKDDADLAHYEATVRSKEMQWQAMHENRLHSDRAAIDIGISGLNAAILINAGALVALLALIGQLWDKDNGHVLVSQILNASKSFAWGLGFASIDFVIAYFYQSLVTKVSEDQMHEFATPDKKPHPGWAKSCAITAIIMILLAIASVTAFIWGILSIVQVFQAQVHI